MLKLSKLGSEAVVRQLDLEWHLLAQCEDKECRWSQAVFFNKSGELQPGSKFLVKDSKIYHKHQDHLASALLYKNM